jgi:3'(2'), 5'-bisphosphate nucleotidase
MPDAASNHDDLARAFAVVAREAGAAIMAVYSRGATARLKEDRSPVTEADEIAEGIILDALRSLLPGVPVVAEESAAKGVLPETGERFVLVDPLDGTKEFLNRNGEFTVAGCIYAPAIDAMFAAGRHAWRDDGGGETRLAVRPYPKVGLTALCSRSHPDPASDALLARLPIAARVEAGSSLKFCRVAEGVADVYPRFGPTMEWDIAAGHAILAAAGGRVVDPDGAAIRYGKRHSGYRNAAFIAWGGEPLC